MSVSTIMLRCVECHTCEPFPPPVHFKFHLSLPFVPACLFVQFKMLCPKLVSYRSFLSRWINQIFSDTTITSAFLVISRRRTRRRQFEWAIWTTDFFREVNNKLLIELHQYNVERSGNWIECRRETSMNCWPWSCWQLNDYFSVHFFSEQLFFFD